MNDTLFRELEAIQKGSGIAPIPERALLRVSGADSTRWLNGMVTNSVSGLRPGEGAYSFLLNAQGRIQGDCTVYREPSAVEHTSFLLSTTATQAETLQPWLERYIIMDDVELAPAFGEETSLILLGPDSPALLHALGLPAPEPLRLLHAGIAEGSVLLFTPAPTSSGTRFMTRIELRGSAPLTATLQRKLVQGGAVELSPKALEANRVREGIPLFGTDIRDRDLPQETGQPHALHFSKGCYLGQEIVERIRSRGEVHRVLTHFELHGDLPHPLPAPLEATAGDTRKPAGELTSAVEFPSPMGTTHLLALGYLRREWFAPGTTITYAGGTAVPLNRP